VKPKQEPMQQPAAPAKAAPQEQQHVGRGASGAEKGR